MSRLRARLRSLAACIVAIGGLALPLSAETVTDLPPLPTFSTCLDIELARFERNLRDLRKRDPEASALDIVSMRRVAYCGTVGIVRCDRMQYPIPCQIDLKAEQNRLRQAVLDALPAPAEVADPPKSDDEALYHSAWALAQGSSAGPDCAGQPLLIETWCEAREANNRVQTAVLSWQIARFLGAVPTAVDAGWANPPPPVRPKARPESLRP